MKAKRLIVPALVGAICLSLIGCSGETKTTDTTTTNALATPVATATVAANNQNPDDPPANATGGTSGSSSPDDVDSDSYDQIVSEIEPSVKTDFGLMKLEPGTERYFQNGLNDAELAYVRARNEKKRKARLESAEARKDGGNSGLDAPVHDIGGDGVVTVREP